MNIQYHYTTLILLIILATSTTLKPINKSARRPNVIVFLADDFGYGDLSVYGHPTQEAGPIDQMAAEGMKFTQFYSVATFCTPSRASLLTGRLPQRSGMIGKSWVHLPCMNVGLPHEEITIAEAMKELGYKTGMVGKWHQGINKYTHYDGYYLPHNQGFDYVGTMLPHTLVWDCDSTKRHIKEPNLNKCFAYYNQTITQQPIKLDNLTSALVQDTQTFLYDNYDKPFFFYVSFGQTHTPMHGSGHFKDSRRGMYGDQVNEMSWAVGEILGTLKLLDIDDKTMTLFTSDHGPHREMCAEGGATGGMRGGKGNFNEGGVRIPAIVRWPGVVPSNSVSHSVLTLMDLLPTLVDLAGGEKPKDRVIDGRSFSKILLPPVGDSISNLTKVPSSGIYQYSPDIHQIIFFYCLDQKLMAVRYKQYKIHFRFVNPNVDVAHRINCDGFTPKQDYYHSTCVGAAEAAPPIIYDLSVDPGEEMPLPYKAHKAMIKEAWKLINKHKKSMVDPPLPLLTIHRCDKKYIPCCNPPFCIC